MVVSFSVPVFADDVDNNQAIPEKNGIIIEDVEDVADVIADSVDMSGVKDDIELEGDNYIVNGEDVNIGIPTEGDGKIVMETEKENSIIMGIPDSFADTKVEMAGEGTVVYKGDEGASLAVQGMEEVQDNLIIAGVRSMVIITSADAEKSYEFEYDLPDGCKLITAEEYNGGNLDAGYIYIVNENNVVIDTETGEEYAEMIGVIEPAWAKDANGNAVETRYALNGNTLTQVVEFDESSAFPIIADPKTSTKPKSKKVDSGTTTVKINLAELSGVSLFTGIGQSGLTKAAKSAIKKKVAKKVAAKFVPVLGVVSLVTSGISYAAYKAGYKYVKVTIHFEKWTTYKRQGGRWVKGYIYRNSSVKGVKAK